MARGQPGTHGEADPLGHTLAVAYVDYDKLVEDFRQQAEALAAAQWAMGDLVASLYDALHRAPELKRQFAKQGISMSSFARSVGQPPATLEAMRRTAEVFGPRERVPALSWEHHWAVVRGAPGESVAARRKWLREAVKQQWSAARLSRHVRPRRAGAPQGREKP